MLDYANMLPQLENKKKSLGDVAYQKLLQAIEMGVLKSGDRISVNGLADILKLSRTPVREAISWLETDGLVVHEPYVGRVVADLNRQMVSELYDIRFVLETSAAGLAALNASSSQIDELQEMLVFEKEVLSDPIRRERQNTRFHEAIYRSAHNRYLISTLKALQTPMILLGPATAKDSGRVQTAYLEHVELINRIENRDENGAREIMLLHLKGGLHTRINSINQRNKI